MDTLELKRIANRMSDLYLEDNEKCFMEYDNLAKQKRADMGFYEWFVLAELLNLYVNIKSGIIDKFEGKSKQREIFERAEKYTAI